MRSARLWSVDAAAEITLEANPTSVESGNFAGYRAAGVNRVSVGVQALDDAALKALGRQHTASEALAAFRLAARIFPRVSFDLIYARPGQTIAAGATSFRGRLPSSRATCRSISSPSSRARLCRPCTRPAPCAFPMRTTAADLYETTQELTAAAGLDAYEVSNHAAPGHESRHNLLYWRYGDYAGVGPGAHSRLTVAGRRRGLATERHPETWLRRVRGDGHGVIEDETLTAADQATERLLMGLRLAEGIPARHLSPPASRRSAVDSPPRGLSWSRPTVSPPLRPDAGSSMASSANCCATRARCRLT